MHRAWIWGLLVAGCGGQCPEAASVSSPPATAEVAPASPAEHPAADGRETAEEHSKETPAPTSGQPQAESDTKAADVAPNPAFPENASVAQAMSAVPAGTARSNIDQDTLGEPLQSEAVYAPCKVGSQHFKVRVAVWNGQAVGVDVITPNKALAACIDQRIRGVEWHHKVRSLNTVEYSM